MASDRLDRPLQRGKVEPLSKDPHEAHPVVVRQQVHRANWSQTHLPPLGFALLRRAHRPLRRHMLRQDPEETSLGMRQHPAHRITIMPWLLKPVLASLRSHLCVRRL
jgi:hypothetical protein